MEHAKMNAEEKQAAELAEELAWHNCKNFTPHKLKDLTFKTAFDPVKALAHEKARRDCVRAAMARADRIRATNNQYGAPAGMSPAERHRVDLQVTTAASVATQPTVAGPAAGPATTKSEDWPITLPRIIPARSTVKSSTDTVDSKKQVMAAEKAAERRRIQTLIRKTGIRPTHPTGDDYEIVGKPSATSTPSTTSKSSLDTSTLDTFRPNPATVDLRRLHQTRLRQDALRKTREVDDGFEIVGNGELDEVFDLVDGEVPSAVNGSKVTDPDPDAIMDRLDRAFGCSWDDDE